MLQPAGNASILQVLPTELILQVNSHLNQADRIALALCCTTLYRLLFPNAIKELNKLLGEAAQEVKTNQGKTRWTPAEEVVGRYVDSIMPSLERHLPSCYYCARCHKLHRYASVASPRQRSHENRSTTCWESMMDRPGGSLDMPLAPRLGYHHGRLVMNRHFYGKQTGLPVEFLNTEQHFSNSPASPFGKVQERLVWKRTCAFRISQDELMFCKKLELRSQSLDGLIYLLKRERFELCCHVATTVRPPDPSDSHPSVPHLDPLNHCSRCLTDYQAQLNCEYQGPPLPGNETTYTVSVTGWHLLGDFRHPLDRKWRAYMSGRSQWLYFVDSPWDYLMEQVHQRAFCRDMEKYPEGEIFQRWEKAGEEGTYRGT